MIETAFKALLEAGPMGAVVFLLVWYLGRKLDRLTETVATKFDVIEDRAAHADAKLDSINAKVSAKIVGLLLCFALIAGAKCSSAIECSRDHEGKVH